MHAEPPPLENPNVFYKALCYKEQSYKRIAVELAKYKRGESVKMAFHCVGESGEKQSWDISLGVLPEEKAGKRLSLADRIRFVVTSLNFFPVFQNVISQCLFAN